MELSPPIINSLNKIFLLSSFPTTSLYISFVIVTEISNLDTLLYFVTISKCILLITQRSNIGWRISLTRALIVIYIVPDISNSCAKSNLLYYALSFLLIFSSLSHEHYRKSSRQSSDLHEWPYLKSSVTIATMGLIQSSISGAEPGSVATWQEGKR